MAIARSSQPPPLPGCTPLFDGDAMREADRAATEDHGMPSILLMERAGLAAAAAITEEHPGARAAVVVVGTGNNGGDGMVVARHLAEAGLAVRVLAPGGVAPRTPDAATMTAIAAAMGIAVEDLAGADPPPAGAVVVDALLGTGASGPPREPAAAAIAWMDVHTGPVVALDVPSGVDADTGRVEGACVRAGLTVTFHGDMVGLRVTPGAAMAGRVVVADIGVPSAVALAPAAWLAAAGAAAAVPPKGAGSDKYASGAAPQLQEMAAGFGFAVADLAPASVDALLAQAARVSAVALGPGVGRAPATTEALLALLDRLERPVVLDADGLWHLGDAPERLAGRGHPTILTPHSGEAARLLGRERAAVDADRLACARELARRSGAVVVLKGRATITASPSGEAIVNAGGSPALATAGTGDVLTGTLAAFLAKGMDPPAAAACAAAVHARAGELADRGDGTVASDVLEALPEALAEGRR